MLMTVGQLRTIIDENVSTHQYAMLNEIFDEMEAIYLEIKQIDVQLLHEADDKKRKKIFKRLAARIGSVLKRASTAVNGLQKRARSFAGNALGKMLEYLAKIWNSLLSKMPGTSGAKLKKTMNGYVESFAAATEDDLGENFQNNIKERVKQTVADMIKTADIPDDASSKQIKTWLDQNKKQIANAIRQSVLNDPVLTDVKNIIKSRTEEYVDNIEQSLEATMRFSIKGFAAGAAFMLGFGFVDNFGLYIGVGAFEEGLAKIFPTMTTGDIGAVGNAFSDVLGVVFGAAIAAGVTKLTGSSKEGTVTQSSVGVAIGCLVPLFINALAHMIFGAGI